MVAYLEFLLQTMSDVKMLQHEPNKIEGTATKNTCYASACILD